MHTLKASLWQEETESSWGKAFSSTGTAASPNRKTEYTSEGVSAPGSARARLWAGLVALPLEIYLSASVKPEMTTPTAFVNQSEVCEDLII